MLPGGVIAGGYFCGVGRKKMGEIGVEVAFCSVRY